MKDDGEFECHALPPMSYPRVGHSVCSHRTNKSYFVVSGAFDHKYKQYQDTFPLWYWDFDVCGGRVLYPKFKLILETWFDKFAKPKEEFKDSDKLTENTYMDRQAFKQFCLFVGIDPEIKEEKNRIDTIFFKFTRNFDEGYYDGHPYYD